MVSNEKLRAKVELGLEGLALDLSLVLWHSLACVLACYFLFFRSLLWVCLCIRVWEKNYKSWEELSFRGGIRAISRLGFHLGIETKVKMDLRLGQMGIGQLWKRTVSAGIAANFATLLWMQ